MTAQSPDGKRDVIPRWRDPRSSAAKGELQPLGSRTPAASNRTVLAEREEEWEAQKSLGFATDLLGTALVVGSSDIAREAADFVLDDASGATTLARMVARRVLGEEDELSDLRGQPTLFEVGEEIRQLKERLVADPRNTLAWTEIARFYTIRGHQRQADRAMRVALGLAPNHRYVLRAASRLAIHHGEFDAAHRVIARSPNVRRDPWLMAAELAASGPAGVRTRFTKQARAMLSSGSFSEHTTSELASALGTLEFRGGSSRQARRLLERSLLDPSDNSVAQGEWVSRHLNSLNVSDENLEASAEAQALRYSKATQWREALAAAWEWHYDQPFASAPGEIGSYQAGLGGAFKEGAEIAEAALRANPGEFLLTNNLAFSLAKAGDIDEALERFARIDAATLTDVERPTYLATSGLLQFRLGNQQLGRDLYEQAIAQSQDRHHAMVAQIMLATEELRVNSPDASEVLESLQRLSQEPSEPSITRWLEQVPELVSITKT